MRKFINLLFVGFTLSILSSCFHEDSVNMPENDLSAAMLTFKSNFPSEYQSLFIQNKQILESENKSIVATSIPVIVNGVVKGRFFEYSDGESFYYDLSNYKKQVTIYNTFYSKSFQSVGMKLDLKTQAYIPDLTTACGSFWCKASCTLGAMAIAASDGPVSLMDALAFAYGIACLVDCES